MTPNERFAYVPAPVPESPTLIAPLETVTTATPTFTWEDLGGAVDRYTLQVYDRTVPGWVHNKNYFASDVCDAGVCSHTISESLGFHANHLWRVRGYNAAGWGSLTPNERFAYEEDAQASQLLNGGFESGTNSWLSCSDSGVTTTSADASEGNAALEISGADCLYQEFSVTPGASYTLQCDAKATGFASITFAALDSDFSSLDSEELTIDSTGYQSYTVSITAPAAGAIGVVTFYSEGTANVDACSVVAGQGS